MYTQIIRQAVVWNEEHLQIIRQGVEVWNEWRQKNPELRPNLNGAILSENVTTDNKWEVVQKPKKICR